VAAEGVVSQRTPTFCAVRLEGDQPGGHASVELQYSVISGMRSDAPPEGGPEFNLGDTVTLVHPPGQLSQARLKEGFAPAVSPWPGWLGLGLVAVAVVFLLAGRRRRSASSAT
jgi:hypothetical protein